MEGVRLGDVSRLRLSPQQRSRRLARRTPMQVSSSVECPVQEFMSNGSPLNAIPNPSVNRSQTDICVEHIMHEWTVKNFSHCYQEYLENFATLSRGDDRMVWSVKIYPKGNGENNKDFVFLCLNRMPQAHGKCAKNGFKCSFSLRNADGKTIDMRVHPNPSHSDFVSYVKRDVLFPQIQPQDVIVVTVDIDVVIETVTTNAADEIAVPDSAALMSSDLETLLDSGSFSDFTIKVGDVSIQAHRCILASRSSVFAAMLTHETEESRNCTLEICDFEPDVIHELIRFMYCGRCNRIDDMSAELLIAADKYNVEDLKIVCERVLSDALRLENVCEVLMMADRHGAMQLRQRSMDFVQQNIVSVTKTAGWALMLMDRADLVTEIVRDLGHLRTFYLDISD